MFDPDINLKINTYAKPTFGYRMIGGRIEKDVFDGTLPEGWADSPANVSREAIPDVPKRRGRPPKIRQ